MASERLIIAQGSAADVSFTVTDPENNDEPLDMSEVLGIVIILKDKLGKIWARFSKNTTGDLASYKPIDTTDAETGVLVFSITEEQSIKATPGKLYCEMKVTFESEGDTEDDNNYTMAAQDIGDILDNDVKDIATY